jgi:hypothetical protein
MLVSTTRRNTGLSWSPSQRRDSDAFDGVRLRGWRAHGGATASITSFFLARRASAEREPNLDPLSDPNGLSVGSISSPRPD